MKIKNNIKIGGEFDINPLELLGYPNYEPNNNLSLYSSGRIALMIILKHIGKRKKGVIHIPYYICGSVYNACKRVGFHVKFYELNDSFLFPLDYLRRIKSNEVLLTVNYFGFVDDNSIISNIKKIRPDIAIISDQVQSFWTYDKTNADYSFTSLRKHFPLPEGALIYSKDKTVHIHSKIKESSFNKLKLIGSLLKHQGLPDNLYLKFFEEGETELENEYSLTKASLLTQYLYEKINLERANQRRRENYKFVYEQGMKWGLNFVFPYNKEITPLNVPILIQNRDIVRRKLMSHNVFLPVHWPQSVFNQTSTFVNKLGKEELSIVIDQRYSKEEIAYEIKELININNHG